MLQVDRHLQSLCDLEDYARELAAGRSPRRDDVAVVLDALRVGTTRGSWLLRVLNETLGRVSESEAARRQFFHAARALVFLRRDSSGPRTAAPCGTATRHAHEPAVATSA